MRKIIHIDADSFYASVEVRDNPSLRDKPIAVGGSVEQRGVIATASYAARKFGVRSAISSARALQLCPDLLIVAPRFDVYRQISKQFHAVFADYTELVEPLSLDEAYLDVTDCSMHRGSATLMADEIRQRIREELHLTVSAGVAPNKFLAKVASDWNKPDGTFTVAPGDVAAFVETLPVSKINGVGKVTAEKLHGLNVTTCGDLQTLPVELLVKHFGKYGVRLSKLAHGIDDRPVQTTQVRKSISVERTYPQDIESMPAMTRALDDVLADLATRFEKIEHQYNPTKRFVKVTFRDFTQTTMEQIIKDRAEPWLQYEEYRLLLAAAWQRESIPIRLLGAGLRLEQRGPTVDEQLALFETMPT